MERSCYNCGDKSHLSQFCDKKQKYTRCTDCNNVAFARRHHKENCRNKNFQSEFLATSYVAITPILGICLPNGAGMSMVGGQPLENGTNILYSNYKGLLTMNNDECWFHGIPGNKYVISMVDADEKPRALFYVGNSLVINGYYHISASGMVKYNPFVQQNAVGRSLCDVKMGSNDAVIQMTVKWCGRSYNFDAHKNGIVYIDPIKGKVQA